MEGAVWIFQHAPQEPTGRTGINPRAYLNGMPDEKMRQCPPMWTDDQMMDWDSNFRDDGAPFPICCDCDFGWVNTTWLLEERISNRTEKVLLGESRRQAPRLDE